jgi:hypothetical protein
MTIIANPKQLPSVDTRMHLVADEAAALKLADGRKAWLYRNELKALYVYIETGKE